MSALTFQSEVIMNCHIYTVDYEVDFEKGIILYDVEKGFSRINFKGVPLVFDVGNSSHNLMPISHGKCLSASQMTVLGACMQNCKHNTESTNCQTSIKNS